MLENKKTIIDTPRITWVTKSFLDYRVPVYREFDKLIGGNLTVITSDKHTPNRALEKLKMTLGDRAVILSGEKSIGTSAPKEANKTFCIPWQPGLYGAIKKTNPDIVIGDGFFQWSYPTLAYKIANHIPMVMCYERTFHTERNAQWIRTIYRRLALFFIDAMCCNGRLSGEYSKWLGMSGQRITYGHMVADTTGLIESVKKNNNLKKVELRESLNLDGLVLLYVGKLVRMKGLRELLSAWELFDRDNRGVATLVLLGDGDERCDLQGICDEKEINNVIFAGAVDYDEMASYYALADALVMPTLEDNWSLVVPEAMVCGLPVLCSKYNGCWPELIEPNVNGWVFDPLNIEEFVAYLENMIDLSDKLKIMGKQSEIIVSKHTAKEAANAIYEACKIAISR